MGEQKAREMTTGLWSFAEIAFVSACVVWLFWAGSRAGIASDRGITKLRLLQWRP